MNVLIVGGGVMGLSCAWRLARAGGAGVRVEVLEGRKCGEGASLAALGALWPASPLVRGALQRLHRESLWGFEGFLRELEGASGRRVSFARLGRIELLNSVKAVARARKEVEVAAREWPVMEGGGMRVLEAGEIEAKQAGIASEERKFGALWCGVTAQVNVGELVGALSEACVRAGVVIREGVRVLGLVESGGRVTGVRTVEGVQEANVVLIAAGAWTGGLGEKVARAAAVRPVKGQGIVIRQPVGFVLRTIVKSGAIYLIPWQESDGGGEILVGATTEPEAGFDEGATEAARGILLAGAAGIFPGLAGAEVLRQWAGLRPQMEGKGALPVMGVHPAVAGLFLCVGHYKTGIGMAPRVSELMARSVLEGRVALELEPFGVGRV